MIVKTTKFVHYGSSFMICFDYSNDNNLLHNYMQFVCIWIAAEITYLTHIISSFWWCSYSYHDNNSKAIPYLHSLFFKWYSSLNTVYIFANLATHLSNTASNFTIHRPVCISMDPLQSCVEFPGDLLGPWASVYLI